MSIPKRTILDRFDEKRKRQGFEQTRHVHRRSTSESSINNVKKLHLPRLKTPPEWPSQLQNDSDLKRGKLTVVPPVQTREAFVSKSSNLKAKQKDTAGSTHCFSQQQGPATIFSGVPVVPYGHPVQSNSVIATNSGFPYPYPSGTYPVPVYMNYAPLLPPIQNPTWYHMGNTGPIVNKRFLTRDEAATSIQKYFKGWKVRKDSTISKLQFLSQGHSARVFIDDFISEILQEELIPDVLIEILSHKKSLSPYDPLYTMSSYICSDILNEDICFFIDLIAASVFYSQDNFRVTLERTDPLIKLCQDLTNEVVNEMALTTVQSTIKSLVQSHMTFTKSVDWLEDFIIETIQPMINNVAIASHAGYKYEATLDDIIDDVTSEMMKPVIHEAWQDVIDDHCDKQTIEIAKFSEGRLLNSLFVDHLLGHLSGNNLSLYIADYAEQTMDGLVCSVLLKQYMLVYDTSRDTLTNKPLQKYHQDNYANMALDVIVNELCASLNEDMLDLLEKEKHST